MDNFDDLKNIWLNEKAEILPEPEAVKTAVATYQKSKKRNVKLLLAAAVLLLPVIVYIIIYAPAKSWTTVFGEILILIGFIMTVILKFKTLQKTNESEMLSNDEFLKSLQNSMASKPKTNLLQIFGMITISVGYGFFVYDSVNDNVNLLMLTYILITLFVLGMYFIFRPFVQRKSRLKSQKLVERISRIEKQF